MFEGVVTDPREADVGSILGFGYRALYRRHAVAHRRHGAEGFRRARGSLAAKYGDRFAPPEKLFEMAENGETFYGTYGEKQKAA